MKEQVERQIKGILIKAIEDVRADRAGFGMQWRELVALDNRTGEIYQLLEKRIQQAKEELAREVQKWIDENNVFRVEFGHHEPPLYTKWIPLQTHKVNILEVLNGYKR